MNFKVNIIATYQRRGTSRGYLAIRGAHFVNHRSKSFDTK
jgi:hypothetical protein